MFIFEAEKNEEVKIIKECGKYRINDILIDHPLDPNIKTPLVITKSELMLKYPNLGTAAWLSGAIM